MIQFLMSLGLDALAGCDGGILSPSICPNGGPQLGPSIDPDG